LIVCHRGFRGLPAPVHEFLKILPVCPHIGGSSVFGWTLLCIAAMRRVLDPPLQPVGRISNGRGELLPWGPFTKEAPTLKRFHANAQDFRDLFFIQEFHLFPLGRFGMVRCVNTGAAVFRRIIA
jgi:hypothetical protein